jgi:peptide/nickel transport system permease protein
LQGVFVLLLVTAVTFALLAAVGGDALSGLSADPSVSARTVVELRHTYGLDQPVPLRYARWLGGIATGNLGSSFFYRMPVWAVLKPRIAATLALALTALLIATLVSAVLGLYSARWPRGWIDRLSSVLVLLGASTPRIVMALFALAVIVETSIVSIGGAAGERWSYGRLLIASSVLAVPVISLLLAQVREGLQTAMNEEFVTVARAKGLGEWTILLRHALRAALNPVITIYGYSLGGLIGGSVIVETVLAWPGLGQLSVIAVKSRDVPLLMGIVLVSAAAVLLGNLLADLLILINDPRARAEKLITYRRDS